MNAIEQLVDMIPWEKMVVGKRPNGEYMVAYKDCAVQKGVKKDKHVFGKGTSLEFAANDYIRKIHGKKLIFHQDDDQQTQEFIVTRL